MLWSDDEKLSQSLSWTNDHSPNGWATKNKKN